ncbi:pyridoxal phosphate-dependent aminotransferase [Atopobacter sp. AH10]|uniref:MalY/PatB family protein n=1 Tax=Atopobacter sp. AH10 TaxID=2315861 RepID=UPI000EF1F0C4|nr:MalY/PatB family protein [Atopobacter sp. AH10]RLK62725.1 pyridoxal phosphate-dependent aminotransferase [Atopobacter sp. AH10]
MIYDFETTVDRLKQGSRKWMAMRELRPDVREGVVPFSVADSDIPLMPEIREGLKAYLDEAVLGYTSMTDAQYQAVIDWQAKHHQFPVKKEWILTTCGVVAALHYAVQAFSKAGEGVAILTPVYPPFYRAVTLHDRLLVDIPLKEGRDHHFTIDFDGLEEAIKEYRITLLLFCSPHNPVGRVWTKDELTRLASIAEKYGVIIACDEIHNDLIRSGYTHQVLAQLNDWTKEHVLTFTAPSKTFNIAGLQTSVIIIPNEELRRKFEEQMELNACHGANALGLKAMELAYTQGEAWLEGYLTLVERNIQVLGDFLSKKLPKAYMAQMEGTYLAWVNLEAYVEDLDSLMDRLYDEDIFFTDGSTFGEAGRGFVRVNLSATTEELKKVLDRLANCIS